MADNIDFTGKMLVKNYHNNTYAMYKDRAGKFYVYYNHAGAVDDVDDTNTRVVGNGEAFDNEMDAVVMCEAHQNGEVWDVVYKRGEKSLMSSRGSFEIFADGVNANDEEKEVWNIYKWDNDDFMMNYSRRIADTWNKTWAENDGIENSELLAILYNEASAVEIAETLKKNYR